MGQRSVVRKIVCALAACISVFSLVGVRTPHARAQEYVAFCPAGRTAEQLRDPALRACRNLDVQLFLPAAALGSTFTIDRPGVPRHMTFTLGLATSWARAPFQVQEIGDADADGNPDESGAAVASLLQTEALAALGLFEVMELNLALPVATVRASDKPYGEVRGSTSRRTALGDLRLGLKVPLLRGGLAVSGALAASLPTGADDRFLGLGYWTLAPTILASRETGRLTLAIEAAYRFRRATVFPSLDADRPELAFSQGDELDAAVGADYALTASLAALVEVRTRYNASSGVDGSPSEVDLGARWKVSRALVLEAGAGTGLLAGVGAPSARFFASVRYSTEREACAGGPEDYDGYQDEDFCADVDNDADGVLDRSDLCPNDAEDRDGFADDDGCPDRDNDGDGITGANDRCPLETEDLDGFEDSDGCLDGDNDADGLADYVDGCPMEPEDRDDYQDDDGCPEPGPEAATVTVAGSRIMVSQRVYFDFDQDTIRSVSLPLLDQVATVVRQLPSEKRVRVDGYSDDTGTREYNLDLSYRRARAVVQYLVSRGVAAARLDYRGYGDQNAVAPNDSPEGRALNRRVEFTILEPTDTRLPDHRRHSH